MFPDRGTVYDFYFVKQASGSWNNWIERVDKAKTAIPKDAKVCCRLPLSQSFLLFLRVVTCPLYSGTSLCWYVVPRMKTLLFKPGNTWPYKFFFSFCSKGSWKGLSFSSDWLSFLHSGQRIFRSLFSNSKISSIYSSNCLSLTYPTVLSGTVLSGSVFKGLNFFHPSYRSFHLC